MEEENKISVYIKTDSNSNITDINSDVFINDIDSWIKIDEGIGDKYTHAQGNYFSESLTTENGIYRYKYIDNEIIEKTDEEIENETENSKNETENNENDTEFSETERIQAEMLLNQERIITKQNEHDEILAELLLGQQKGV